MKWNIWLSLIASISVYLGLAFPLWIKLKNAAVQHSAPPGSAFMLAVPYAVCSGIAVFIVCWLLQNTFKI